MSTLMTSVGWVRALLEQPSYLEAHPSFVREVAVGMMGTALLGASRFLLRTPCEVRRDL